jgi:hypothetical protein
MGFKALVQHPSPAVAAGLDSFPFPFEASFLLTILDVTSFFTRIRSGAEDACGGDVIGRGRGSQWEEAGNNLDLILGAAAAAGQMKMKGQGSKNASEGVSKP